MRLLNPPVRSGRKRPISEGVGFLLVVAAGIVLAYVGSGYVLQLGGDALALGMAAMGLDFLVGYTGRVSFGQAAWLAVGAFASGYLFLHGWDVITGTLATIGIIIVLSAVMGAVATITGGLAFAIVTLAEGVIIYTIINHLGILGAGVGLFGIPLPKIAGQTWLASQRSLFLLALVLALICYVVVRALVAAPAGRFCQAIRDDEMRARSIGVEVQRYQILAFVVASVVAGIGGVAFVVLNGGVQPSQGAWDQSGLILVMLIIGGTRTLYGGFIGAFIYVFAQNYLTQSFANDWQIYLGAIFVVIVLVLPGGLVGGVRLALSALIPGAGQRRRHSPSGPDPDEPEIEQGAGDSMVGVSE
jgi:branched-chain amino acid transport system permease protein